MSKKICFMIVFFLCFLLATGCSAKTQDNSKESSHENSNVSFNGSSNESSNESSTSLPDNVSDGSSLTESENPNSSSLTESESPERENLMLSMLKKNIKKNDCILGVAFIDYVDSGSTFDDICSYLKSSRFTKIYTFMFDCNPVICRGSELYAFVPENSNCTITIYESGMTEDGEYIDYKDTPLYQGEPGESIILCCNISEIYSNVLVSVTDGTKTLEFHPMLSMMDGHMVVENGCYDFSIYENNENNEDKSIEIARELLVETDEVRDALNRGMDLLCTGDKQTIKGKECIIFALGTYYEDQFIQKNLYAVSDDIIYTFYTEINQWQVLGAG